MKKLVITLCAVLLFLFIITGGLKHEQEIKESTSCTEGVFTFDIPVGFILDEKDYEDGRTYYISTEFGEASKVIYDHQPKVNSVDEINLDQVVEETNLWLREEYLVNSKSYIEASSVETVGEAKVLRYTIAYNLLSAVVTHHHIYHENDGKVEHLEYTCVEEEGYNTSFRAYYDGVIIS